MSNGTSAILKPEQGLASVPMAQGGLTRLAIARLKSAGVLVEPLLRRAGLTPEMIAQPETRLSVRSQITLLNEAAIALKDDCIGFTLARDFDPRELGLLYYVMASSQTLGDTLKRLARYSKITNEALVFGYREGNRLIINVTYSGVPRHSDRHQMEFCMFAVLRICRALTGHNIVPQHFSIAHHRSGGTSEMTRFVGTKVQFGADTDEFALNVDAREIPVIHSDTYLSDLLLKYCEAALADRRGDISQLRTKVENAISSLLPHGRVRVEDIARALGMSERTLARKLSHEGLKFTEILEQLRRDLAVRYLDDRKLHRRSPGCSVLMRRAHSRMHVSAGPERRRARCELPALIDSNAMGKPPHEAASGRRYYLDPNALRGFQTRAQSPAAGPLQGPPAPRRCDYTSHPWAAREIDTLDRLGMAPGGQRG